MHAKVDFLCGKRNNQFSCGDTFSSHEGTFENQFNTGEVGIAKKEILTRRRGKRLPSQLDETESKPPAKSPEKEYPYYKQFPLRLRDEPAAVNLGAHEGLKNSNVNCYSNAIFQCIASCISFSDFSPSENHPQFPLNLAFASLMNSMIRSEESVDPLFFMNVFTPLFRPQGMENGHEQEGMYYD